MRELWQHERLFLKFPPHYFNDDDGGLLKQPSSQSWCSRTFSPANMRQMMCEEFAHGASHLSDFGIPFFVELSAWSGVILQIGIAARENLTILRKPVLSAGPRLLIQLVFIAALIASVWPRR
jgi:hypothetical protein